MNDRPEMRQFRRHIRKRNDRVIDDVENGDLRDMLKPGEFCKVTTANDEYKVITTVIRAEQPTVLPLAEPPAETKLAPAPVVAAPTTAPSAQRRRQPAKKPEDIVITPAHERIARQATDVEQTARQLISPFRGKYNSHTRTLISELVIAGKLKRTRKNCYVRPKPV